jgi:hypothetical protein
MKKTIFFLLFASICVFTVNNLFAQTKKYNWTKYGVSFSIPTTHEVKKNAADEFESGDDLTWIQMMPFKDSTQTAKGMIEEVAKAGGFTVEEEGAYTSGGYDGYWVRSTSSQYPEWQYWLIAFIDPNSSTNFYAIIWWKKGNDAAYKIAYDMSYSFKKIESK